MKERGSLSPLSQQKIAHLLGVASDSYPSRSPLVAGDAEDVERGSKPKTQTKSLFPGFSERTFRSLMVFA